MVAAAPAPPGPPVNQPVAPAAPSTDSKPTTPARKKVSLLLSDSPASSPASPRHQHQQHDGELTTSPTSPRTQHEYTSLAALRKANKGKTIDRTDRTNGWHFTSTDGSDDASRQAGGESGGDGALLGKEGQGQTAKKVLSTLDMICLTAGMGGAQIAWCLEMGFGNQELLALGLSEELTSLVWLAGPISGLVTQPLIGAISDSSTSRYRRRFWIVLATVVMMLSTLALAFAQPLGGSLADLLWSVTGGGGKSKEGDWDPKWREAAQKAAIGVAVASFYGLDFAVNALQASLRNLLLDVTPAEQLSSANAWQGRMTHLGNCVGFTLGFLDLSHFPLLAWLGGGQFRKFCVIIIIILGATVWVTCWATVETARVLELGERPGRLRDIVGTLYNAVKHLPRPIRRVCYVQIFAFMSWFPFLFYSTTWVLEVMKDEQRRQGKGDVDRDAGARAGSLAMLFYSIVAVIAGTVLPYLAERDRRLLAPDADEDDEGEDVETEQEREFRKIKKLVDGWKREAKLDPKGKPVKLPTMPFMLRNIWTSALVLFSVLMIATFFVTKVWQASALISLVGICWAVASWVPFSLLMEYLKEMQDVSDKPAIDTLAQTDVNPRPLRLHARTASTPGRLTDFAKTAGQLPTERSALLKRSRSMVDTTEAEDDGERRMDSGQKGPVAGGTVLGIHNLSIVFPQFIVAIISSLIFKAVAASHPAPSPGGGFDYSGAFTTLSGGGGGEQPVNGVAWVLRFGGMCALIAAAISRRVPPTKTEKAMRRRLAEMRAVEHEDEEEAVVVVGHDASGSSEDGQQHAYGATSDRASA